jgi:hypothetical protein
MNYREALAHVRGDGKARRPHWHKHSYLFADLERDTYRGRDLWLDHRPYYPKPDHSHLSAYLSCDGDRTADDWLVYKDPDD